MKAPRIIFDRFSANRDDVKLEDLIYNIRTGVSPEGVVQINFETRDKYVIVDTSMMKNASFIWKMIWIHMMSI